MSKKNDIKAAKTTTDAKVKKPTTKAQKLYSALRKIERIETRNANRENVISERVAKYEAKLRDKLDADSSKLDALRTEAKSLLTDLNLIS